jgi:hypothetical protein
MTLEPTARLRWVERAPAGGGVVIDEAKYLESLRVLQQWWAPAVPAYMRNPIDGEWRDVETGVEAP